MAKKKYYAVKKGHTVGIFETWEECQKSINGFSGQEFHSFPTYEEAQAYLEGKDFSAKHVEQAVAENTVIAYTDGSFDPDLKKYSYGCVILTPEGETIKEYNCGNKDEALPSRNVAGELLGAMYVISWTINHGYDSLIIRHDYEGLAKWFTGDWKANSYVAIEYIKFLQDHTELINIAFEKVPAHSGDKYNEEADKLAKMGLQLTTKKKVNSGDHWFTVQGIRRQDISTILDIVAEEMDGTKVDCLDKGNETMFIAKRGKDRLVVRLMATGKTVIQGRPRNLFHAFVSYITQLLEVDNITPVLNSCYKVQIENAKIEDQYLIYLPHVPSAISPQMKNSLLQSIYNLNYTGDMFEFSYLLHPILRVLDGHLKTILSLYKIPLEKDRLSCFHTKFGIFKLKDEYNYLIPDKNMIDYINTTYNFYRNHRHSLFHWDAPINGVDTTRTIENKQDADKLIKEALSLIDDYYILCNS